jgi:hypothetical protein
MEPLDSRLVNLLSISGTLPSVHQLPAYICIHRLLCPSFWLPRNPSRLRVMNPARVYRLERGYKVRAVREVFCEFLGYFFLMVLSAGNRDRKYTTSKSLHERNQVPIRWRSPRLRPLRSPLAFASPAPGQNGWDPVARRTRGIGRVLLSIPILCAPSRLQPTGLRSTSHVIMKT